MKLLGLKPAILNEVLSIGHSKSYQQGNLLGEKKHSPPPLVFVRKGAIRVFSVIESGEITHCIRVEGEFCCSNSFFSGMPVSMQMEVLETAEVTEIYRDDLHELYFREPATQQFGRLLAESQMSVVETNYQIISQKSATERNRLFQQFYPHINGRFSLKYISSWLQIDQATLSRVRSNKQRQTN